MNVIIDKTKLSIAKAIYTLRSEVRKNKVTVKAVAKKAKISRQAIYKFHKDLLVVIQENITLPEIYLDLLVEKKPAIFSENIDLKSIEKKHIQEFDSFRKDTLTALMINDITLHKAKLMKSEQVNTQKQLTDRTRDNRQLELKVGDAESKLLALEREMSQLKLDGGINVNRITVYPDMEMAFDDYKNSGDKKDFYLVQDMSYKLAIKKTIDEVNMNSAVSIHIFIHRHNADTNKYIEHLPLVSGCHVFLSLPVVLREKRRGYFKKLFELKISVNAVVPVTNDSSKVWFRNVNGDLYPDVVIKQFDESFQEPMIHEGFNSILYLKCDI